MDNNLSEIEKLRKENARLKNGLQYLINFPMHVYGDKTIKKMKSTARDILEGKL